MYNVYDTHTYIHIRTHHVVASQCPLTLGPWGAPWLGFGIFCVSDVGMAMAKVIPTVGISLILERIASTGNDD